MRGVAHRGRLLTWGLLLGAAGAALAPAGPAALDPLKMAIASADSVGNDIYVAVVVDFGSGSDMSSISKCVPVASTARDSDALAVAVGSDNVSYNNSGLLCAIDNYPVNGVQDCGQAVGSGIYDYWSYWHGASGTWVYANDGPAEQPVASSADDVEGWRFQTDEADNSNDPPPALPASYAQVCNATTEMPPSQLPTSVATTTTSATPSVTTTTGSTTTGSGHPPTTTVPAVGSKSPGAETVSTTTTTTTTATTVQPEGPGARGGNGTASGAPRHADASASSHQKPGGSGSPVLPVVLVGAVVVGLGGLALIRWRRRPADE